MSAIVKVYETLVARAGKDGQHDEQGWRNLQAQNSFVATPAVFGCLAL
jgi:hypothetical protein